MKIYRRRALLSVLMLLIAIFGASEAVWAEAEVVSNSEEDDNIVSEIMDSQYEALNLDELYGSAGDDAINMLDGMDITNADLDTGLSAIFNNVKDKFIEIIKNAAGSAAIVMAIGMLCALVNSVYDESGQAVPSYVNLVGVIAIAAVVLGSTSSFLTQGVNTLRNMREFTDSLLPVLSTLAIAGGAITSATAKYAATILFLDVLMTVADKVFMPIISAYLAVSVASAAFGGGQLSGVQNVLKWMANAILTGIMVVFVTYITVSGIITSSADAATTRVAKTVISTAIPIVGGIISDAASSVVAGASMLKGVAGVFGMLVVLAMIIVPFLKLGASYLMYKLASGLSQSLTGESVSKLIGNIGSAYGMVMGLLGAGALMTFFGILSLIKVVGG